MLIFLFKAIAGIILFTCLTIVNVGCLWVLKIMLDELISDEIAERIIKWAKKVDQKTGKIALTLKDKMSKESNEHTPVSNENTKSDSAY